MNSNDSTGQVQRRQKNWSPCATRVHTFNIPFDVGNVFLFSWEHTGSTNEADLRLLLPGVLAAQSEDHFLSLKLRQSRVELIALAQVSQQKSEMRTLILFSMQLDPKYTY